MLTKEAVVLSCCTGDRCDCCDLCTAAVVSAVTALMLLEDFKKSMYVMRPDRVL